MFWTILLCHFIADYPLQTDGMVVAKKTLTGLVMHVSIHLITMIAVLCGILNLPATAGTSLALAVSLFHFAIDFWKNVLFRLKPDWIIFSYVQDQILHILSILLVTFIWQEYSGNNMFSIENKTLLFATGLVLVTNTWFITERVLSYQHPDYQQWVIAKMWPRMMLRAMFYSLAIFGFNLAGLAVLIGAFIVAWNDLEPKKRIRNLAIDCSGVVVFMALTWAVISL